MAELKTQKNDGDVEGFLASVENDQRREDATTVCGMMEQITGQAPAMWGSSIVGFGENRYLTVSGKEATWFEVGFSPRKQALTLYIMDGFDTYHDVLSRLGSHSTGKACLYIKRLSDVDLDVLAELIGESVRHVRGR